MASIISGHPQFFTASVRNWEPIFKDENRSQIITDSLSFLVKTEKVLVHSFVIMPTHIHLIWQMRKGVVRSNIQRDFMKYTARKILVTMEDDPELFSRFIVNKADREMQIWKRNALSVDLFSREVYLQKLNYIHANPIQPKWKLCKNSWDY